MGFLRLLAIAAALLGGTPALADPIEDAGLESAARAGRQSQFWVRWLKADRQARVEWGRRFLLEGGTVAVAAPLVQDLWTGNGEGRPAGEEAQREAVLIYFYAYLRLRIDGQSCWDPSGPGDLLHEFFIEALSVARFAANLPPESLRSLAHHAAVLELRTAGSRGLDPFVCSRGRLAKPARLYIDPADAERLAATARAAAFQEILSFAGQPASR